MVLLCGGCLIIDKVKVSQKYWRCPCKNLQQQRDTSSTVIFLVTNGTNPSYL